MTEEEVGAKMIEMCEAEGNKPIGRKPPLPSMAGSMKSSAKMCEIEDRRQRVARLYAGGMHQAAIARHIGVTQATVCNDMANIRQRAVLGEKAFQGVIAQDATAPSGSQHTDLTPTTSR